MTAKCSIRSGIRGCGGPALAGLPLCAPHLSMLLAEADPSRRRTLADHAALDDQTIIRLAHDPDPVVRQIIAGRDHLPPAAAERLGDPTAETELAVRWTLASTPIGVQHAAILARRSDPEVLLALAANPSTPPPVLNRLANHPDPSIATAAVSSRAGLATPLALPTPPDRSANRRLNRPSAPDPLPTPPGVGPTRPGTGEAHSDTRKAPRLISTMGTPRLSPADSHGAPDPSDAFIYPLAAPPPKSRFGVARRSWLGALGTLVVGMAIGFTAGHVSAGSSAGPSWVEGEEVVLTPPATIASALVPDTTTSTTAPSLATPDEMDGTPATPNDPEPIQPSRPPVVLPDADSTQRPQGPTTRAIRVTSATGKFCGSAQVVAIYSPSPASVIVTDDAGEQVARWTGPSDQTHNVELERPTATLTVVVEVSGDSLSASASAAGESC